jgi:hypothetical protein
VKVATTLIVLTLASVDANAQRCMQPQEREEIRALALRGIDQGFVDKVAQLFSVWVADPHEQPKRAIVGMDAAIKAYVHARANATQWNPPECKKE